VKLSGDLDTSAAVFLGTYRKGDEVAHTARLNVVAKRGIPAAFKNLQLIVQSAVILPTLP